MSAPTKEETLQFAANRAITNSWSNASAVGTIAGAGIAVCFPVGLMFAGMAGAVGVGALAVTVAGLSLKQAYDDSIAIQQGNLEAMGLHLKDDDFTDIGAFKLYGPDYQRHLRESARPKALPHPGAKPESPATPTPPSESGTGTSNASAGDPYATEPPKLAAPPLTQKPPSWPDGEHLFMVGLSGGAKTTVLQGITANIQSPVVYLTIKSDDTAPPDWVAYRLDKFAGERLLRQLDWLIGTLETWVRQGKTHRLIIDEYVSLRDAAKTACKPLDRKDELKGVADRFEALVKVYIRAGRSDGHYLGLLSQTPNGTDNFDSAKTQQGLRVFLCASERSSEKFRFFVPWAKQMFADLITHEAEQHLRGINSGFWHLFADGGQLVLNATPAPTVETVPCQECPTAGFVREAKPEPAPKASLEDRIVGWLSQRTEPEPAWMIRNYCTDKSDRDRPDVLAIKDLLAKMPQVRQVVSGRTEKYELVT